METLIRNRFVIMIICAYIVFFRNKDIAKYVEFSENEKQELEDFRSECERITLIIGLTLFCMFPVIVKLLSEI